MKILLLTDIPPCKNLTAGLVLDQLCNFLPHGSLVCFTVLNPHLSARLSPDLGWIPITYAIKPEENAHRWPAGRWGVVTAAVVETYRRLFDIPVLLEQAETFASLCQVDAIWAVLQGQTMVRLARPLADRLGVPLYTQVWDPLSWWLTARRVDPWNRALALEAFDAAMRRSLACATASWPMAEEYSAKYGILSVPVISSHDPAMARHPHLEGGSGSVVTIGMAGQFYAAYEWNLLIKALNHAGWKVCGKDVRIITMGGGPPPCYYPPRVRLNFWVGKASRRPSKYCQKRTSSIVPIPLPRRWRKWCASASPPSWCCTWLPAGRCCSTVRQSPPRPGTWPCETPACVAPPRRQPPSTTSSSVW